MPAPEKQPPSSLMTISGKNPHDIINSLLLRLRKVGIFACIKEFYISNSLSPSAPPDLPGVSFHPVSAEKISSLSPIDGKDASVFLSRIKDSGDECIGIFYQNTLAGYVWLSRTGMRIPELKYERPLGSDEIYSYDGVIKPEFRRRKLFDLFIHHLTEIAAAEEKTIIGAIDLSNYKSRRAHIKHGYRKIGTCVLLRFGKLWEHRWENLKNGKQP